MTRFLLLLILSLEAFYGANGCSCFPSPPQDLFCIADFVIKVKVKDIEKPDRKNVTLYLVDIIETYRATHEAKAFLKYGLLTTSSQSGLCGVKLQLDQVVVVGGTMTVGIPRIGTCDLNMENIMDLEAQEIDLRRYFANMSCPSASQDYTKVVRRIYL